jgi:uncharacterized protein YbjT (DUF2867 family)
MGRNLIPALLARGHAVRALLRPGSEKKLPRGCTAVTGDALKAEGYASAIAPADTFVQLVGVAHPNPSKAREFREIDFQSARGAIDAATAAGIRHFIYLSVAQPAPVMKDYIAVRAECEVLLRASGLNATIVRPWYVLGPGRRWPLFLVPMYWIAERIPATRDAARRLGLVTLAQMTATLLRAVEHPPAGVRVVEVPEIRATPLS